MKIEIGSKWQHKDGEVYEIMDSGATTYAKDGEGVKVIKGVAYKDQQSEIYVRTEKHFLESFKPYLVSPVYEHTVYFELKDGTKFNATSLTCDEAHKIANLLPYKCYRILADTRRERKQ